MAASYTDRLIIEVTRDVVEAIPPAKRQQLEPVLRAVIFKAFDEAREVLDYAAEHFPHLALTTKSV
jgi:hypothetical protein